MLYFYSHIIEVETIVAELDSLELTESQRMHLAVLIDSTIHYTVLDIILSKLSEEDKITFIIRLKENPKDQSLLDFLSEKVEDLEQEIKIIVEELKQTFLEDIKEVKLVKKEKKHD